MKVLFCCCPGCIRQLLIQGEEVIFKDLHQNSTGVTNCPTCKDHPCQVSPPGSGSGSGSAQERLWSFASSSFRTGGLARTLRPACIGAVAPGDSRAATANITLRCTATQVPGGFLGRRHSGEPSELTPVFVPRGLRAGRHVHKPPQRPGLRLPLPPGQIWKQMHGR